MRDLAQTKAWDHLLVAHSRLWTGPLPDAEAGYDAGTIPGENAIDSKTYENTTPVQRPVITVRNVVVYGFSEKGTLVSNRSAFNVKYSVDWRIDGATIYDNQNGLRIRGPWNNAEQGGAHLTIMNALMYDNTSAMRVERLVEKLHIYNSTFANNQSVFSHMDTPGNTGYDPAGFEMENCLFLGEKPAFEAADSSNFAADESWFSNAAQNDFSLIEGSPAIQAGIHIAAVTVDIRGLDRPADVFYDAGAYQYIQNVVDPFAGYVYPGLLPEPAPSPEICPDGRSFYVAAAAVNGDGTLNFPFNDIQTALNLAQPGDTVYVMPGTYDIDTRITTVRDATEDRRISLVAYDPYDRPVLRRSLQVNQGEPGEYGGEILLIKHPYFLVDGFVMDGAYTNMRYYYKYRDTAPYETSYTNLIAIPHYGGGLVGEHSREYYTYGYNGDHAVVRNCELRRNRADGLYVAADDVLIENCEIHLCLRGVHDLSDPDNNRQVDAHGISGEHLRNLTVRNCDIHHVSGDCFQLDPDVPNDAQTQLWDNVWVENCRMWTSVLTQKEADFDAGTSPGENGIDTKTFENIPLPFRPKITVKNLETFGFLQEACLISNRAALNIKYQVDWLIDGVYAYDNQVTFRVRGPWNNAVQGNANLTLMNALVYGNTQAVFRVERHIENLHVYNCTFADNRMVMMHVDSPDDMGYDVDTFEMKNCLFLGEKPMKDAWDPSNLSAEPSWFANVLQNDYSLSENSPAIDAGETLPAVQTDVLGLPRPVGAGHDVGAYEIQTE